MKWLFDNVWIVIAIAAVIAKLVQAMRGKGAETDNTPAPPKEFEFEDTELAERTRKIREEIRRKIEERRGQHTRPAEPMPERPALAPMERSPEATPPPVVIQLPELIREVLQPRPEAVPEPPAFSTVAQAEEAERQAALTEQVREAEEMKAAAERRAAFEASITDQETARLQQARTTVLDDLRDPAALRRAFILREVLGPPVALR